MLLTYNIPLSKSDLYQLEKIVNAASLFFFLERRINQRRHRQRELDEIAELEAEADDLGMHLKVWTTAQNKYNFLF